MGGASCDDVAMAGCKQSPCLGRPNVGWKVGETVIKNRLADMYSAVE
eukprot:NODE_9300_length_228_cov_96.078212_g8140_i0.p1 GENE.NODE_9300_length_228_cov_96.078212_g8140_i0~~NODE_9300_length_228_cov_96.078212_g8140_i0.p1  ORF type:complete len:57 (+),score=33.75 NODE_9300_length_228_cov_96.078212_g8140_i0:32-172(+)